MTTAHLSDTRRFYGATNFGSRLAAGAECGCPAADAPGISFPGGRLLLFALAILEIIPASAEAAGTVPAASDSFVTPLHLFLILMFVLAAMVLFATWISTRKLDRPLPPQNHEHPEYITAADLEEIRANCTLHKLELNRERSNMLETLQRHLDHMRGEIREDLKGIREDAEKRTVRLHDRIDSLEKPTMELIGQIREHIRSEKPQ